MKNLSPIKILLVEDNPGDARLVEELLAEGHAGEAKVVHCETMAAGLHRLSSERFDLVLLDMSMPDSQWLGTFDELDAAAPQVPVVVLTGIDDDVLAMRSIGQGAQDYLVKGEVSPPQLGRAIRFAVERARVSQYRAMMMERQHFEAAFATMEAGTRSDDAAKSAPIVLPTSTSGVPTSPRCTASLSAGPTRFSNAKSPNIARLAAYRDLIGVPPIEQGPLGVAFRRHEGGQTEAV